MSNARRYFRKSILRRHLNTHGLACQNLREKSHPWFLAPAEAGTLATAGALVFSVSNDGNFFALDAETSKPLWETCGGGTDCTTNPITYAIDGEQWILFPSDIAFIAFPLALRELLGFRLRRKK
ncbi:MAG: hypothetical protein ACRD5K_03120 [Candidatus Acidiferrales bacterium]